MPRASVNLIYIHKWWSLSEYRQNKNVIGPTRTVTSTCIWIMHTRISNGRTLFHILEHINALFDIDSIFVFVVASEGI